MRTEPATLPTICDFGVARVAQETTAAPNAARTSRRIDLELQ